MAKKKEKPSSRKPRAQAIKGSKRDQKIELFEVLGPRKLTRFERARVVGARALQIAMGAPVLIDVPEGMLSPIDIAELELRKGVLPMSIRRSLPDGTSQNIPLKLLLDAEGHALE